MKTRKLLKEIKGVFQPPVKRYYLGKLRYGTPYFFPHTFNKNVITIVKLKEISEEEQEEMSNSPGVDKNRRKFSNIPCSGNPYKIVKIFKNYYYIGIGTPIYFKHQELGWKDKWNSPQFEWEPAFYIFLFKWQFAVKWVSPDDYSDDYYEMVLWYLNYCYKDISQAKETWPWVNFDTKESTWNEKYLIKK